MTDCITVLLVYSSIAVLLYSLLPCYNTLLLYQWVDRARHEMRHTHQIRSILYKQAIMIVSVDALGKAKMRNTHRSRSLRRKTTGGVIVSEGALGNPAHMNKGS